MTRGRGLGLLALIAAVSLILLPSCGGEEGPSESDAATIKTMLSSSAAVQEAFGELYACLPRQRACYTENGPPAVTVVEEERQRFVAALDETEDDCLREAGGLYLDSLDSYGDAADAAVDADATAFDEAISRTTESEIAYNRKLTDCGFTQGRLAEIGAAMREVNVELLRLGEEIGDCLQPKCVQDVARRMEEASDEGVALLEDYRDELTDAPDCILDAVDTFLSSFRTLASAARAIQANDFEAAERDGTRAGQLAVEAQEQMAACLGSLGA